MFACCAAQVGTEVRAGAAHQSARKTPRGRGADAQPSTVNPLRFTDLVMQLRFQRAHRARLLYVTAGTEEGTGRTILIPGMCRHLDSLG